MSSKKIKTVAELKAERAKIEELIRVAERQEKERIGEWVQSKTGLTLLNEIRSKFDLIADSEKEPVTQKSHLSE